MSGGAGFNDNVLGFRRSGGPPGSASAGSSGGEPPDDMKDRIEALEKGHRDILDRLGEITGTLKAIDAKLDGKADAAALERVGGEVRTSLATAQGKLDVVEERINRTADAASLAALNGKIGNVETFAKALPTTKEMIGLTLSTVTLSLIGIVGVAFAIVRFLRPGTTP